MTMTLICSVISFFRFYGSESGMMQFFHSFVIEHQLVTLSRQGPDKKTSSNKNLGLLHLNAKNFGRGLETCSLGRMVAPSTTKAKSFIVYAGMWLVIIIFYPTWK